MPRKRTKGRAKGPKCPSVTVIFPRWTRILHNIYQDLFDSNLCYWMDSKTKSIGLQKLYSFCDLLNDIDQKARKHPIFKARKVNQENWDILNKFLQTWDLCVQEYEIAGTLVKKLPANSTQSPKNLPQDILKPTRSAVQEINGEKSNMKNQESPNEVEEISDDIQAITLGDMKNQESPNEVEEISDDIQAISLDGLSEVEEPEGGLSDLALSDVEDESNDNVSVVSTHANFDLSEAEHPRDSQFYDHLSPNMLRHDFTSVPTEKHPEKQKPKHFGKIKKFPNLFRNSFQMEYLYDPTIEEPDINALSAIEIVKFNGNNIEDFPQFEMYVVIRIINKRWLDFDVKCMMLMSNLAGTALYIVQSYFYEELNMQNFVSAIEALWYAYGEPTKFRNALLRQLINGDPVDMKKPDTLINAASLIRRIINAFGSDEDDALALSCIMESLNITKETSSAYYMWLWISKHDHTLQNLLDWLKWNFSQTVDLRYRASTSSRRPLL